MDDLFLILIILSISAGVIYLVKKEVSGLKEDAALGLIKQDLKGLQEEIRNSGEKNRESLENQLKESGKIIREVTVNLEKIHSDNQNVLGVKDQLGKLTDILANPKQRGILGEYFLETLLKNIFQPSQYKSQYQFKNGEIVDAAIFVKDKIIPVDSKFSLENYNKILEEKEPNRKLELEKVFKQDLKTRIEETAKYIRPEEGTMDFAFMFIPSEGVYYDLLINQVGGIKSNTVDLIEYAFKEKHVIIVSPTSFYAYLQTVLQGLKALQIEESAKEIKKQVESLQKHLLSYNTYLQKLGSNLSATVNAYNQTSKEFNKIDKDIVKLTESEKTIEPLQIEKPE